MRCLKIAFLLTCLFFSACQNTEKLVPTQANLQKISDHRQEKSTKENRHQYKYVAESALLLFYAGKHIDAEPYFEKAHQLEEDNYTRSTTELILSKIVNENTKRFRGHYLERWHLRYLAAINYLSQQKIESGMVELRRLSRMCRLEKDPFQEKIIDQARYQYLFQTGVLLCLLGSREEGLTDLRYLDEHDFIFPSFIKNQSWLWKHESSKQDKNKPFSLVAPKGHSNIKLNFHLKGQGPQKKEQRLNITMFGVLPLIQAYANGQDGVEVDKVNDIATGVLGKRLVEIAYPVLNDSDTYSSKTNAVKLNFGDLFYQSWDAQKNRLIAQSALRIISKVYASYQVEHAIEKNVEGPWGQLIGNIGRMALWKTEQADIRQIEFLPSLIYFNWDWEEGDTFQIDVSITRKKLF